MSGFVISVSDRRHSLTLLIQEHGLSKIMGNICTRNSLHMPKRNSSKGYLPSTILCGVWIKKNRSREAVRARCETVKYSCHVSCVVNCS